MRTTLDIDEDVLIAAKEIAACRQVSTGKVVSELMRKALIPKTSYKTRNGVPQFPIGPGGEIITMELVNRLRDEE